MKQQEAIRLVQEMLEDGYPDHSAISVDYRNFRQCGAQCGMAGWALCPLLPAPLIYGMRLRC
jgi:hypothetical protein